MPYGIDMVQARDVWDTNVMVWSMRVLPLARTDGVYHRFWLLSDHEDLPNAIGGYSQVDDNWARDGFGHGSHVGGTIRLRTTVSVWLVLHLAQLTFIS